MSKPHAVLIAPPWYPVPPSGYGGIELVVDLLAEGLQARGWRVTLLAAEGSHHRARVLAPQAWRHDLGGRQERMRELHYAARVAEQLRSIADADVVHDHAGFGTLVAACLTAAAPVVHTVHGALAQEDAQRGLLAELGDAVSLVAISAQQRSSAPELHWTGCVHNAVDTESHVVVPRSEKQGYLLCLARICEDKGQHMAIDVAERADMPLVLAGKVERNAAARDYFERLVRPRLGEKVRHIPNVAGRAKSDLLARATALLAPAQWDEPFGLSVAEAMVSGTPAISTPRGAAPELIEVGLTGYLAEDVDAMVEAVARSGDIDPHACAEAARRRFGPDAMVDGYVGVYEKVLAATQVAGSSIQGGSPRTTASSPPEVAVKEKSDVPSVVRQARTE